MLLGHQYRNRHSTTAETPSINRCYRSLKTRSQTARGLKLKASPPDTFVTGDEDLEPPTAQERSQRAEQQRTRRLATRTCGHCGEPAHAMMPWGKQHVAICSPCQLKLEMPATPEAFCAFDEVHPKDLRPQTSLEAVVVEARLLPASETVIEERKPSLVSRMLGVAGWLWRRGERQGARAAISGESD